MLSLRQLETFRAVMRYRTTSGAAKALTVSQPAISNAIKQMESQVGFPLFERIGNRMVPTSEAEEIYRDSEAIFSLYRAFSSKIQALERTEAGELRIIATQPLANALLPTALRSFLADRPDVRVSFDTRRVDGVIEGVETRLADIGFALAAPPRDGLVAEHIGSGQMICAFPPDHRLANRIVVTPKDLVEEKLIAYERNSRLSQVLEESFLGPYLRNNVVAEVRYSSLGCLLAEAGIGVAIVDSLTAIAGSRYALVFRPLMPSISIKAVALYRRGESQKRLVRAFLAEVRKAVHIQDSGFF